MNIHLQYLNGGYGAQWIIISNIWANVDGLKWVSPRGWSGVKGVEAGKEGY